MNAMSPYALVLGVLGAGAAAFALKQSNYDMAHVESTVDHQKYIVRNLPDKQEAADRLARHRHGDHRSCRFRAGGPRLAVQADRACAGRERRGPARQDHGALRGVAP